MFRIGLMISCGLALAGCSAREFKWSETPKLADGSTIDVERSIKLDYEYWWMRDPYEYSLVTRHPSTGAQIEWHGDYGIAPILLAFEGDKAYLVVIPSMCDADLGKFGNPKLPYVALRLQGDNWEQIKWADRPASLHRANLYSDWNSDGAHLSAERIDQMNSAAEIRGDGFFHVEFPNSFEDWKYKYKSEWGAPCGSRSTDLRNLPEWK